MDGEAFERARKEHMHPLWRTTGALAAKDGGHGGWKTAAPAAIGDVDLAALGLA